MSESLAILQKYWGHTSFRDPQEKVIDSVLNKRDTLALMPTGGGKSICFQVPTMMTSGICLVITPLIALMQDQVQQLQSRGIKALSIHTGMSARDIDIKLDNCVYGDIKFLYVSPERLLTDLFKARVAKMKVSLLVVDEAHCISQWGYDFRPAYLEIANIRSYLPQVSLLALTATATPEVRVDICEKLDFEKGQVFQVSFARKNLSYQVVNTEDKLGYMIQLLKSSRGSTLIYVSTRKRARNIAQVLQKQGFSASFYHGGLTAHDRRTIQDHWVKEHSRIMVATNAFGMGIDKPNVRLVIHHDLTDHLEGYYQEAGRAGRDSASALAVLLYQVGDVDTLKERKEHEYPSIDYLKEIYQHLANHYQLAIGSITQGNTDFDLEVFSKKFKKIPIQVFYALKKLQLLGFIELTESFFQPSQLQFTIDHQHLYEFQIANANFDPIIKAILRLYGGEMFTRHVQINEHKLAKILRISLEDVQRILDSMQERQICVYQPQKEKPQLAFTSPRQEPGRLNFDKRTYQARRTLEMKMILSVQRYVQNRLRCRSLQLLEYFGEISEKVCGICDICMGSPEESLSDYKAQHQAISRELMLGPLTAKGLVSRLSDFEDKSLAKTIQRMLDSGDLMYDRLGRLILPGGLA